MKISTLSKTLLSGISYPVIGKIKKLKNSHKGEVCNIYGDGVSIKWFDIKKIPERYTFTLGMMPFHKYMSSSKFVYLFLIEPYYFYPFIRINLGQKRIWWRNNINNLFSNFIKTNEIRNAFINLSNLPSIQSSKIKYIFKKIPDKNFDFGNLLETNKILPYKSSLRAAITVAIYMGFSRINLIGCDYTHKEPRARYWYEKGEGKIIANQDYEKDFLVLAQRFVDIQTITIDGTGSVLPSITYKDFCGDEPKYKENDQLLDNDILKILNTYPIYKIF